MAFDYDDPDLAVLVCPKCGDQFQLDSDDMRLGNLDQDDHPLCIDCEHNRELFDKALAKDD